MNWFDILLIFILAATTALASERKLTGIFVGLGGLILLRPLLLLANATVPLVALIVALIAGLALGFAGRITLQRFRGGNLWLSLGGGISGFLLGCALILAVVTSLPIERDFENRIVYPPRQLPVVFQEGVMNSRMVRIGRDILLYPLLVRDGAIEPSGILGGLHGYLVTGEPWKAGGN